MTDTTQLDQQIIAAHERGAKADLVDLYTQAADMTDDTDRACFFLTQAYIFALDAGHDGQMHLHARLKDHGRI